MSPAPTMKVAAEINRLHEEAKRCAFVSREALQTALAAAWQAGQLLLAEKQSVRRRMGPGAWLLWLEQHFRGTPRTAQRYMKLSRAVSDLEFLKGMSLRQAYARLGIATEPKTPAKRPLTHPLPAHVLLANRLARALKQRSCEAGDGQADAYRRDLRFLYEQIRPWFENGSNPLADFTSATGSSKS